jgi:hypothetical protein
MAKPTRANAQPRNGLEVRRQAAGEPIRYPCLIECVINNGQRVLPLPRYGETPGQPAIAARSAPDSRPSRLVVNRCGSRSDYRPAPRSTVELQDVGVRPGRRGRRGSNDHRELSDP